MKNIFILLFTLMCASSCEYNEHGYNNNKTAAAKLVYDETTSTLKEYIDVLYTSQKIDLYLQAEESERDEIKYKILEGYDILEKDNNIILVRNRYEGIEWVITRNSTDSLSVPSTQWIIDMLFPQRNSSLEGFKNKFSITAQSAANTWHLEVEDYMDYSSETFSSASLKVKMETNFTLLNGGTINEYSITMAGETAGEINSTPENMLFTSYQITSPLSYFNYSFSEGKIEIKVIKGADSQKDDITAEILRRGDVSILFRGITEIWADNGYLW